MTFRHGVIHPGRNVLSVAVSLIRLGGVSEEFAHAFELVSE